MKTLSIIILAAGKGERMKSLKPKVLHEVANYPILFHVLSSIKKLNPKTVNLVISEELKKYQDEISFLFPEIKYSIQQEQKGTADAVKAVKKKDGDITLILFCALFGGQKSPVYLVPIWSIVYGLLQTEVFT